MAIYPPPAAHDQGTWFRWLSLPMIACCESDAYVELGFREDAARNYAVLGCYQALIKAAAVVDWNLEFRCLQSPAGDTAWGNKVALGFAEGTLFKGHVNGRGDAKSFCLTIGNGGVIGIPEPGSLPALLAALAEFLARSPAPPVVRATTEPASREPTVPVAPVITEAAVSPGPALSSSGATPPQAPAVAAEEKPATGTPAPAAAAATAPPATGPDAAADELPAIVLTNRRGQQHGGGGRSWKVEVAGKPKTVSNQGFVWLLVFLVAKRQGVECVDLSLPDKGARCFRLGEVDVTDLLAAEGLKPAKKTGPGLVHSVNEAFRRAGVRDALVVCCSRCRCRKKAHYTLARGASEKITLSAALQNDEGVGEGVRGLLRLIGCQPEVE